ncbi:hypothetical protein ASD07_23605 [Duganella sp. Root336D2]|nr:hypothetical protein ASD07_23605 [Duganella sp. Root336D2]
MTALIGERFQEVERDLQELRLLATTRDEIFGVQGDFASLYAFQNDLVKAEAARRAQIAIDESRVEGWLGLAEHFHYYDENLEKAFNHIEKALVVAMDSSDLVRQVLGVKIRICLKMANYQAVEQALEMLVGYQLPPGAFDVALESDFLSKVPLGEVSAELIARYQSLLKARGT